MAEPKTVDVLPPITGIARKERRDKGIPRKAAKKGKTGGVASYQTAPESRQDAPGGVLTP